MVLVLWTPPGFLSERICGGRVLLHPGLTKILRGFCLYLIIVISYINEALGVIVFGNYGYGFGVFQQGGVHGLYDRGFFSLVFSIFLIGFRFSVISVGSLRVVRGG